MNYSKLITALCCSAMLSTTAFAQEKNGQIVPIEHAGKKYNLYPIPEVADQPIPEGWSAIETIDASYAPFIEFLKSLSRDKVVFYWANNTNTGGIYLLSSPWVGHKSFGDVYDYVTGDMADKLGQTTMLAPMRLNISPISEGSIDFTLDMPGGIISKNFVPWIEGVSNFTSSYTEKGASGNFNLNTKVIDRLKVGLSNFKLYDKDSRTNLANASDIDLVLTRNEGNNSYSANLRLDGFSVQYPILSYPLKAIKAQSVEIDVGVKNISKDPSSLINKIFHFTEKPKHVAAKNPTSPEIAIKMTGANVVASYIFSESKKHNLSDVISNEPLDITMSTALSDKQPLNAVLTGKRTRISPNNGNSILTPRDLYIAFEGYAPLNMETTLTDWSFQEKINVKNILVKMLESVSVGQGNQKLQISNLRLVHEKWALDGQGVFEHNPFKISGSRDNLVTLKIDGYNMSSIPNENGLNKAFEGVSHALLALGKKGLGSTGNKSAEVAYIIKKKTGENVNVNNTTWSEIDNATSWDVIKKYINNGINLFRF